MYKAIVGKINTKPLEGSDNIQLGTVLGYQVIVGKEVKDEELGIFFEQDGQLSTEFATANDLIRRKNLVTGAAEGGYFEDNRRVKAISMRGARSEGFWIPLTSLNFTLKEGKSLFESWALLVEGYEFDTFNDVPICNKYVTPQTARRAQSQKQGNPRKRNLMFPEHIDTKQFKRSINSIPPGSHIIVTEKVHGTSHRLGHVLETVPIKRNRFMTWLTKKLGIPQEQTEWTHINGTRHTVMRDPSKTTGFYGSEGFRLNAVRGIELHKGEVVYCELVGYTEDGKQIMATHHSDKLKDKAVTKKYGADIVYKYGCEPGTCKLYVYRITNVNLDGVQTDLSWNQVKQRCTELGLKWVPEIDQFFYEPTDSDKKDEMPFRKGTQDYLAERIDELVNGKGAEALPSLLDSSHPMEGVVVRVESGIGTDWLKEKSWIFKFMEGIAKEDDTYEDMEESS